MVLVLLLLLLLPSGKGEDGSLVAPITSRIISSKAAVSSACFCVWRAIFSLNFLGFAIFRS